MPICINCKHTIFCCSIYNEITMKNVNSKKITSYIQTNYTVNSIFVGNYIFVSFAEGLLRARRG